MKQESESAIPHPILCNVGGCSEEATLAKATPFGYSFLCDKHRADKKREYQRDASWRHRLKVKHGIILPPPGHGGRMDE